MRKLGLITIILASLFTACTSNNYKEDVKLVNEYIAAVETLDFEAMATYLDESYMGLGPSISDTIYKEDALLSWKENVTNLYEKIEYTKSQTVGLTITEGPNKGDWVSNWAELQISYKNQDTPITIWANSLYQVEGNKIIKSITFYNEADAYRQLGYSFYNPSN